MKQILVWIALLIAALQFVTVALPPGNADLISIQLQALDLSHGETRFLYPGKDFAGNDAWVAHHEINMRALGTDGEPNWCFYPPLPAFVLQPLARLDPDVWRLCWAALQIIALVLLALVTERLLISNDAQPDRRLFYSLFLGSYPALRSLELGQTSVAVALIVWLAVYWAARYPHRGAVALGVSAYMKPFVLLTAFTQTKAIFKFLTAALLTLLGLSALSIMAVGFAANRDYIEFLLTLGRSFTAYSGNQSLMAGILRVATGYPVLDYSFAADDGVAMLGRILALFVLSMTAVAILRSRTTSPLLTGTLCLSAGLLALPISWEHHLVLLLPGLAYLWCRAKSRRTYAVIAFVTAAITINFTALYSEHGFGRFVTNLPLLGNLILFVTLVREHLVYRYRPILNS